MGSSWSLWLRWSWRDLRYRWVSVVVIAVIIAIGTGVFAGLGSTAAWRRQSNDASFAALNMHDLRLELSPGTFADEGHLVALSKEVEHAGWISRADERLLVGTQIDVASPEGSVLVRGRIVGMEVEDRSAVDALSLVSAPAGSRAPTGPDGDAIEVVLESKFAEHHKLADQGTLTLAGKRRVAYAAVGVTPEYFLITGAAEGGFLAEENYGVVFASLANAQDLTGRPGQVNDLVLTLTAGADRAVVQSELEAALEATGNISAVVSTRDDDPSFRLLYDDIDGDQQLWNVLSLLVLTASAIAAFNLISRIVESHRREIGIQMALGVPPRRLALRPLLIGGQIAVLGALLGVAVGLLVGGAMRSLLVNILPLPVWRTPFQFGTYAAAASLGFVLPFAASMVPVWRAVRVEPIDAIRTSHLKTSEGLGWIAGRVRLPGNSVSQLPLRNLLRTPRRTLLTAVGVGAAIAALVGVMGLLDSFVKTIDVGEHEVMRNAPDRVVIDLEGFQPLTSPVITGIAASPMVRTVDPRLEVPASVSAAGRDGIDVLATFVDFEGAQWSPGVIDPVPDGGKPGVVLARVAANDLGVAPGDTVSMRHPVRAGLTGYTIRETAFTVIGLHASPLRSLAYLPMRELAVFGLDGLANVVDVRPAAGYTAEQVQRSMFDQPGVASAQAVGSLTKLFRDVLEQFVGILLIAEVAVLVLALLIAFNTTSVAVDERARAHATLFAFGLRVRKVVAIIVKESVLVGMAATLFGIALGYLLLRWMVFTLLRDTVPEIGIALALSPRTLITALIVGVLAVGLTPLLIIRRLIRMDIPDTLRVME